MQAKKKDSRGGKRAGAGRPIGSGKYGEPTRVVRIPISMIDEVLAYVDKKAKKKRAGKK